MANQSILDPGSRSSGEATDPLEDDTLVVEPDQGNGPSTTVETLSNKPRRQNRTD
jgi:hypothetical protein